MSAPLTRSFGKFASELKFEHLPKRAVDAVLTAYTDSVAVMYSGVGFPLVKHARAVSNTVGLVKESRLFLGSERAAAFDAALINSAALGAGVFDDVAFGGTHTSVALLPAIFAEADILGSSGKDIITAYAAGYEVEARIMERDKDSYASKGWHASANFGSIAGAAALSNLRKFNAEQTTRAIGIAAAMTGGIVQSFDYDIGPFQVARGSATGVMASRLAASGVSASDEAIEKPGRGILSAMSPKGNVDLDTPVDDLGRAWRLETVGIHVKQYPCGNMMQRALDGVFDIVRKHDVKPGDVAKIEVLISLAQFEVISKSPSTSTVHVVPSHNIGANVAAALIERKVDFGVLTLDFYKRPDAQAIVKLVEIVPDSSIPADTQSNMGFSGGIRMHLRDGRVLESPSVDYARGHWTRPLSADEAWGKLAHYSAPWITSASARKLFDQLQGLDKVASIHDLAPEFIAKG